MSDNDQKSGKVIRASSGSTRLTAGGGGPQPTTEAPRTQAPPVGSGPAGASGSGGGADRAATSGHTAAASPAAPAAPRTAAPTAPTGRPPGGSPATGGQTGSGPTSVSSGGTRLSAGSGTQRMSAARPDDPAAAVGSGPVRASSGGVKIGDKAKKRGPRTVRLTVAKLDPWSVMKMSFLLSVAIGIATVVAALVLWLVLQATGTLSSMQSTLAEIAGTEGADQILGLFSLGRMLSFSVLLALVNVVLITALSTLFAFLYNIGASIVGGFHLTLTDD
ncbi:hypothetical protein GCM10022261_00990 [Brevibacterium daeguense]|uniref:DUF3566 domain-containing protein n=1 Tax=Brevibacterium daeguense TaxID=909936 RepID=A0ABP8EF00_9MICO